MMYWLVDPLMVIVVGGLVGYGLSALTTAPLLRKRNREIEAAKVANLAQERETLIRERAAAIRQRSIEVEGRVAAALAKEAEEVAAELEAKLNWKDPRNLRDWYR